MRSRWYPAASAAVRWYPRAWRERYGAELLDVLDQHEVTAHTVLNMFAHAIRARLHPGPEGDPAMRRLRLSLLALAIAFPLFLVAFASWFSTDEPVDSDLIISAAGDRVPLYRIAESAIGICLYAVLIILIASAEVTAAAQARAAVARSARGAAGSRVATVAHLLAALLAIGGPTVFLVAWVTHRHTPPPHPQYYILALLVGLLAGLGVLAVAAVAGPLNRHVAAVAAVPAGVLSLVMLVMFAALTAYGSDMAAHGVPVITLGTVQRYPLGAVPAADNGFLTTLVLALQSTLAALACAGYATVGSIRAARTPRQTTC